MGFHTFHRVDWQLCSRGQNRLSREYFQASFAIVFDNLFTANFITIVPTPSALT